MSTELIQSFQKRNWDKFLHEGIQELLDEYSIVDSETGVTIDYKAVDIEELRRATYQVMNNVRAKNSHIQPLKVQVSLDLNKVTDLVQSSAVETIGLINLPIMSDLGFLIDGTRYELVTGWDGATGWYFMEEQVGTNVNKWVELKTSQGGKIVIKIVKGMAVVTRGFSSSAVVPVSTFLKALTGMNFSQIKNTLGNISPEIRTALQIDEPSIDEAVTKVVRAFVHRDQSGSYVTMENKMNEYFYSNTRLKTGKEAKPRLQSYLSFSRAQGLEVTRTVGGMKEGEMLTPIKIEKLEEQGIDTVYVKNKEGNEIRVKRYEIQDTLTKEEFIAIVDAYSIFLSGVGKPDNRDSYANKVVKPVSEVYGKFIRESLVAFNKHIIDRVQALDRDLTDILRINGNGYLVAEDGNRKAKPILRMDEIKTHLIESSLAQVSEETNTITSLDKGNKISTLTKNTGREARGVQEDQYGRTDPIAATEGKNIGETHSLALKSGVDEFGFITTEYFDVQTQSIENVNAIEEQNKAIVREVELYEEKMEEYKEDTSKKVNIKARLNGRVKDVLVQDVRYLEVSNAQIISTTLGTVPYIENDYGKRALMSGNMAKQAVPLIKGERPFITTGIESMQDIGVVTATIIAEQALIMAGEDYDYATQQAKTAEVEWKGNQSQQGLNANSFKITLTDGKVYDTVYDSPSFQANMIGTSMHYKISGLGPWIADQIVLHRSDIDLTDYDFGADKIDYGKYSETSIHVAKRMGIAVGTNMKVLFKSQEGFGYEDAIYISEDMIQDKRLSHISVHEYVSELETPGRFNPDQAQKEYFTNKLPKDITAKEIYNDQGEVVGHKAHVGNIHQVDYMTPEGLPRVGTYLQGGQELIGKQTFKQAKNKLIAGEIVPTNTSLRLEDNRSGHVIYSGFTDNGRTAVVQIATVLDAEEGDKLSGRHGNKGVIARVAKREDLPFMEDGTVPDIVLNPLGVPSRMNIGQLLETLAGWISDQTQMIQIAECFKGNNTELIRQKAEELGIKPMAVYDGKTGVPYDRQMYYGVMYMYRLEHIVKDKLASIGLQESRINPVTQQPIRGSSKGGGQKVGEQLGHSILSYGAHVVMDELRGLMSDDTSAQQKWKNLVEEADTDKDTDEPDFSSITVKASDQSDKLILPYMRAFGVTFDSNEEGQVSFKPLTDNDVISLCGKSNKINIYADPIIKEIHNPSLFSSEEYRNTQRGRKEARLSYAYIDIAPNKIIQPFLANANAFLNNFIYAEEIKSTSINKTEIEYAQKMLTYNVVEDVSKGNKYVYLNNHNQYSIATKGSTYEGFEHYQGIDGIVKLIENYNWKTTERYLIVQSNRFNKRHSVVSGQMTLADHEKQKEIDALQRLFFHTSKQYEPKDFLTSKIVLLPSGLRPTDTEEMTRNKGNNADNIYIELIEEVRNMFSKQGRLTTTTDVNSSILNGVYQALQKLYGSGGHFKGKQDLSLYHELTNHSTKNARIRDHALGKRVHFSGRSVITVNPNLSTEQAGIPFYMAMRMATIYLPKLLKSTVSKANLYGHKEMTKREMQEFIRIMTNGSVSEFKQYCNPTEDVFAKYSLTRKMVKDKLQEFMDNRIVLLNREPSLHKYSIQAFKPVIVETLSVQICPLVCTGFNADFDGDQMAVFFLQTQEAIDQAKELMMPYKNIVNPGNGEVILNHQQDMIMGIYYATMEKGNRLNPVKEGKLLNLMEDNSDSFKLYLHKHEELLNLYNTYLTEQDIHQQNEISKQFCTLFHNTLKLPPKDLLTEEQRKRWMYLELAIPKLTLNSLNQMYDMYKDGFLQLQDYVNYVKTIGGDSKTYTNTVGRILYTSMFYQNKDLDNDDLEEAVTNGIGEGFTDEGLEFSKEDSETPIRYKIKIDSIQRKRDIHKLNEEYVELHKDDPYLATRMFNRVMNFSFEVADKSGVSIYLYDFDSEYKPQDRVQETQAQVDEIQQMFVLGMISETEKEQEVISLWRSCKRTIEDEIMDGLDRNSNLFIIIDSGSRGSKDQFMETMGIIGIVTDVKGNPFENPISSNYVTGLNPWEYMDSSHITRDGQISTALGTADSGYLTRRMVMLLQSITIQNPEEPDNKTPDDVPTKCDSEGRMLELEYNLNVDTKYVVPNPNVEIDINFEKYKELLGDRNSLTDEALKVIVSNNIQTVWSPSGKELKVVRKLNRTQSSMLFNRYTDNNPSPTGNEIFTEEDIKYLESNEFLQTSGDKPSVQVYTTLDCTTIDGICQRCFGKGFDGKGFPNVGHSVGFEAAQAIGEPSNQLTMSRFHSGSEGNAAKDGVKGLIQMIELSESEGVQMETFSDRDGKVIINEYEESTDIVVETPNPNPNSTRSHIRKTYKVKDRVFLAVQEGQEVASGDVLIDGVKNYKIRGLLNPIEEIQMDMLKDYTDIYYKSNIDVHARHFELIVKRQTQNVIITDKKDSHFHNADIVKLQEVWNYNDQIEDEERKVIYAFRVLGKTGVMQQGNDILDALADQRLKEHLVENMLLGKVDSMKSPMARMITGNSLSSTQVIKRFKAEPNVGSKRTFSKDKEILKGFVNEVSIESNLKLPESSYTINTQTDVPEATPTKEVVRKEFNFSDLTVEEPSVEIEKELVVAGAKDYNTDYEPSKKVDITKRFREVTANSVLNLDDD